MTDYQKGVRAAVLIIAWVVAGGLGNEDTYKHLQALKESVAKWADSLPNDVADDILGEEAS